MTDQIAIDADGKLTIVVPVDIENIAKNIWHEMVYQLGLRGTLPQEIGTVLVERHVKLIGKTVKKLLKAKASGVEGVVSKRVKAETSGMVDFAISYDGEFIRVVSQFARHALGFFRYDVENIENGVGTGFSAPDEWQSFLYAPNSDDSLATLVKGAFDINSVEAENIQAAMAMVALYWVGGECYVKKVKHGSFTVTPESRSSDGHLVTVKVARRNGKSCSFEIYVDDSLIF